MMARRTESTKGSPPKALQELFGVAAKVRAHDRIGAGESLVQKVTRKGDLVSKCAEFGGHPEEPDVRAHVQGALLRERDARDPEPGQLIGVEGDDHGTEHVDVAASAVDAVAPYRDGGGIAGFHEVDVPEVVDEGHHRMAVLSNPSRASAPSTPESSTTESVPTAAPGALEAGDTRGAIEAARA